MTSNVPIQDSHLIALRNLVRAYGGHVVTRAAAVDLLVYGLVFDEEDSRTGAVRVLQNAPFKK